MAKRQILKKLRKLPRTLEGVTITVGRTLEIDGKTYQPGDTPPAGIDAHPNLGAFLRRGYLLTSRPVNVMAFRPGSNKQPKHEQAPQKAPEASSDDLLALTMEDPVEDIRAALDAAGIEYKPNAKRSTLLKARDAHLGLGD